MSSHASGPDFDPVARIYRWAEYLALGPLLQQTRTAHLDKLTSCRNALLFGDGDGRFLARLLARNPGLRATAIDTSAAMLRLLCRSCDRASPTAAQRLTTLQVPAHDAPVPPAIDLVVTHFFLDCLTQPEVDQLVERVAAAVQTGTLWLLSDFAVPDGPLRSLARLYIRTLYMAFRLLTGLRVQNLPDPQSSLTRNGFRLLHRKCRIGGLFYSELWIFDPAQSSNLGQGATCAVARSSTLVCPLSLHPRPGPVRAAFHPTRSPTLNPRRRRCRNPTPASSTMCQASHSQRSSPYDQKKQ